MTTQCFLLEEVEGGYRNPATGELKQWPWQHGPGAMWKGSYPSSAEFREGSGVPEEFWTDDTWYVCLPNGAGPFCLDQPATHFDPQTRKIIYGKRWERTGEPPNVTLSPSIDASPAWHGHLQNGVMTP